MVKVVVAIVVDVEVDVQLPETRFCTSSSFGNIAIYLATVHFTKKKFGLRSITARIFQLVTRWNDNSQRMHLRTVYV